MRNQKRPIADDTDGVPKDTNRNPAPTTYSRCAAPSNSRTVNAERNPGRWFRDVPQLISPDRSWQKKKRMQSEQNVPLHPNRRHVWLVNIWSLLSWRFFFCGIGIFIVPFGNAANGWTNGKLLKSRKKVLFSGKAGLFVYRVAAPIPNVDTIVLFALLLLCWAFRSFGGYLVILVHYACFVLVPFCKVC